jgi:organic hydroperoxide reductase OsmC/OhrA
MSQHREGTYPESTRTGVTGSRVTRGGGIDAGVTRGGGIDAGVTRGGGIDAGVTRGGRIDAGVTRGDRIDRGFPLADRSHSGAERGERSRSGVGGEGSHPGVVHPGAPHPGGPPTGEASHPDASQAGSDLYSIVLEWSGSTGQGYRAYSRTHRAAGRAPAPDEVPGERAPAPQAGRGSAAAVGHGGAEWVALSAAAAFRGDPDLLNPEQLVVMAATSCQLLSFLAVAARHGVDVVGYVDRATGMMPTDGVSPRITRVELAPVIHTTHGTDPDLVRHLVERAHDECYVARSLTADVVVRPTVVVA